MEIRRVLYPVEFSNDAHTAMGAACALASAFDAELVLAHSLAFPYPYLDEMALGIDLDAYYQNMEKVAGERLERLREQAVEAGASARTEILRGDPAGAILEAVEDEDIDLVVMPTHGRTGFQRLLIGSVTETVIRLCNAPVLTIPPIERYAERLDVGKILVPTDFSDRSDRALGPALSLAERLGSDVLMLHVVTIGEGDSANPDWAFPAIPEEHVDAALEVAESALDKRRSEADGSVRVASKLVRGFDAAEEIVRVADEEEADLVVMATHGHTGLMHVLLGSTAGKVVRHLDRPVLTIRSR